MIFIYIPTCKQISNNNIIFYQFCKAFDKKKPPNILKMNNSNPKITF